MSEPILREGRKVCLLLPWYKEVNPLTSFSVMGLIDRERTKLIMRFGDAFVIHTRNKLVDDFLKSGCEWSLWIDSDMVVPYGNAEWFRSYSGFDIPDPFAGFHTIDRLMSHGKTIVSATYYGRWKHGRPIFAEAMNDKEFTDKIRKPTDRILPTRWCGFGCVLVHRSVFLDIEKKFPHLARGEDGNGGNWFTPDGNDLRAAMSAIQATLENPGLSEGARNLQASELINSSLREMERSGGIGQGEDVSFCVRSAKCGHQPFVDLGLLAGHVGHWVFGPNNAR